MQMYDTEKSYVEALKNLVTVKFHLSSSFHRSLKFVFFFKKYYLPMKDKTVISNDLVNDIFYKIPEIHIHHTVICLYSFAF